MASVTQIANGIKQPKGGYIPISWFEERTLTTEKELNDEENISAALVGLVVDYMTRFMLTKNVEDSFIISIWGYQNRKLLCAKEKIEEDKRNNVEINALLKNIKGLDDWSITCACKAVSYDQWYRDPSVAIKTIQAKYIWPNKETKDNIKEMVRRSLRCIEKYGPITEYGFDFIGFNEDGSICKSGYTQTVDNGDGDFLTKDCMWDLKVIKNKPTTKHTLQLIMYYLMGKHSDLQYYKDIDKIGIYNPRLNKAYILAVKDIPKEVLIEIEKNVIGYRTSIFDIEKL